jgi:hypothetical protein
LIAQDRKSIEVWRRDGSGWSHVVAAAGQAVQLPRVAEPIAVDEFYEVAGLSRAL